MNRRTMIHSLKLVIGNLMRKPIVKRIPSMFITLNAGVNAIIMPIAILAKSLAFKSLS